MMNLRKTFTYRTQFVSPDNIETFVPLVVWQGGVGLDSLDRKNLAWSKPIRALLTPIQTKHKRQTENKADAHSSL